jgi:hypothetical protein
MANGSTLIAAIGLHLEMSGNNSELTSNILILANRPVPLPEKAV